MKNIKTASELKFAIQQLEVKQRVELEEVKEHIEFIQESLRPANLLKTTLNDFTSSSDLKEAILAKVVAMGTGYLMKKITIGSSDNPLMKIVGQLLQFGVTNLIMNRSEQIFEFAESIFHKFFHKEEVELETEE